MGSLLVRQVAPGQLVIRVKRTEHCMYAIVMSVHTWDILWEWKKYFSTHDDNQTVVDIW